MSRSKKGSKAPGWEYWGKRIISTWAGFGTKGKRDGIQKERAASKREEKKALKESK